MPKEPAPLTTSQPFEPAVGDTRKWTVMVFMGADGVEGNASLYDEALKDIKEMSEVGCNRYLNTLVQLHDGEHDPVRVHIGRDEMPVPDGERDLTSGRALADFINWAIGAAGHRPGDYSMLVLWGHAYRFGIGHTETRAGIDALDFAELAAVFKSLQEAHKGTYSLSDTPKLDIVGFDACDLATIEMTIQLQDFADYLLASQIGIPLPGWPYHRILERIYKPQGDRLMGPAELGTYIVRRFCEHYHAEERKVSLTLLDLRRAAELYGMTEVLALRLAQVMGDPAEQKLIYDLFCRSRTDDNKPFVDVADLCLNLVRESSDPFVRDAADGLGDLLISPPPGPVRPGESANGTRRPFVVEHGRNTTRTARLHGVSLYAPHVARTYRWEDASHWYKKFVFVQNTLWSGLIHALAQRG